MLPDVSVFFFLIQRESIFVKLEQRNLKQETFKKANSAVTIEHYDQINK